jgi:hypothetical protein
MIAGNFDFELTILSVARNIRRNPKRAAAP